MGNKFCKLALLDHLYRTFTLLSPKITRRILFSIRAPLIIIIIIITVIIIMLIDVAISGDRNLIKKEAEKILKYKDLTIKINACGR